VTKPCYVAREKYSLIDQGLWSTKNTSTKEKKGYPKILKSTEHEAYCQCTLREILLIQSRGEGQGDALLALDLTKIDPTCKLDTNPPEISGF